MGLVTLVPRTCAVRQALVAWGQQQPRLSLLLEKPGRTKAAVCRRWPGQSVMRSVEIEDSKGQVSHATLCFGVVHASPLAQQQTPTYTRSQAKEAETMANHITRVAAQGFAWVADAEAARADYEGHGQGRRGRRPRPWRYHAVA